MQLSDFVGFRQVLFEEIAVDGGNHLGRHGVLKGENDLASLFPDLARQWHPEKNRPLTPSEVTPNSNRKVCRRVIKSNSANYI